MAKNEHTKRVRDSLKALQKLEESIPQLGMKMFSVDDGRFYPVDLLAEGALKRTLSTSSAFRLLIENWNLVTARALLRMQIDTAARFYAIWLVDDPHKFAQDIFSGSHMDKMKDRDGRLLSDRYLIEQLGKEYEWIPRVYKTLCGYVHLSERHIFSTTTDIHEENRSVSFCIGPDDKHMPDFSFWEVVECFKETMCIFLKYVVGWIVTKANPDLVCKTKQKE